MCTAFQNSFTLISSFIISSYKDCGLSMKDFILHFCGFLLTVVSSLSFGHGSLQVLQVSMKLFRYLVLILFTINANLPRLLLLSFVLLPSPGSV